MKTLSEEVEEAFEELFKQGDNMKTKISENQVQNAILEYLEWLGIFAWRNNSTGVFDPKKKIFRKAQGKHVINGVSDILGILPNGKFLAIEVKSPQNKKRPKHQVDFIKKIHDSGGLAFFADNLDYAANRIKDFLGE